MSLVYEQTLCYIRCFVNAAQQGSTMKKTDSPVPHDGLFKTFLGHTDTARDFLEIYLPPALRKICDLNTLQLESGSFIEEDLRTYFADVLWSLKTTTGEAYIYTLLEHQSSPDRHMAFRLMRYAIAVMQRHLDKGYAQLPLVVPFLFCHGRATPWSGTLNWLELFNDPEVAHQLYTHPFPLIDVGLLEDNDIMKHRRMAMLELVLKHIRTRDLVAFMEPLVTLILAGYTTESQLATLINWMLQTGDSAQPQVFLREMAQQSPHYKELFMTAAQRLEQQGIEKGIETGRREGIRLGEQKAKQEVARSLLKMGLPVQSVIEATGLSESAVAQLAS
jgi:predicted transposase/invertase (TIGR01784 family)